MTTPSVMPMRSKTHRSEVGEDLIVHTPGLGEFAALFGQCAKAAERAHGAVRVSELDAQVPELLQGLAHPLWLTRL